MSLAVVTLKKGEGRTLKAGGAWVFDNEIANILGSYENGDIVLVHDFDGYPMGRGFINEHSKIRIRMMTRHQDQAVSYTHLHHTEKKQNVGKHNADEKGQIAGPVLNQNTDAEPVEKFKVRKTHSLAPPGASQILSQETERGNRCV